MEECNLFTKPGPPPERWTLYFIQHCQPVPAAPDHDCTSSPALYGADTTSLQVARLKNSADLTDVTHRSACRGQNCNELVAGGYVMLLSFSLQTVKSPFNSK